MTVDARSPRPIAHDVMQLALSEKVRCRKHPPFRTLHLRYPVEDIVESLAEGIRTAHPAMPEFQLDAAQIADLIAYLKSLER